MNKATAHEASNKKGIEDLKKDFADAHCGYVMAALTKINIYRPREDGVIDFGKRDIEDLKHIIRNTEKGLPSSIKQVMDGKADTDGTTKLAT